MSRKDSDIFVSKDVLETFGLRIKEERRRAGFDRQSDLAEKIGILMGRQSDYERGKYLPNSEYLMRLHEVGLDVLWILTGSRMNIQDPQEIDLVNKLRSAPPDKREAAIAAALAVMASGRQTPQQVFHGTVGAVIENNAAPISQVFNK